MSVTKVAFDTIIRKEVGRFLRIWKQTLLPSVITISLYFVIFGTFIGSQVDDVNGFTYMQFLVPGLIMMAVITNSYSNVVSSFFGQKFSKAIEELLVSPTPNWVIILGYTAGGVLRAMLVGLLVTLVSLLFVPIHIYSLFYILVFLLLTSFVFSLMGFTNSIFAKKFDDVQIIPVFVLTPLTYLGGVFYSINLLPDFWQTLSKINPILYMVNGFRYGFLGISDVPIYFGLGMLVVFAAGLFTLNWYLLKEGVGMKP
ncbi:MAG: ABC transporter permease [Nanoarchaeota archaeon]|nr:ABC transporter permease [Nanoarchaeota archaeon]